MERAVERAKKNPNNWTLYEVCKWYADQSPGFDEISLQGKARLLHALTGAGIQTCYKGAQEYENTLGSRREGRLSNDI